MIYDRQIQHSFKQRNKQTWGTNERLFLFVAAAAGAGVFVAALRPQPKSFRRFFTSLFVSLLLLALLLWHRG